MLFRWKVIAQNNVILPSYDDDCVPLGECFCVGVQLTCHIGKPAVRFKQTCDREIGWEFPTEQGGDLTPVTVG